MRGDLVEKLMTKFALWKPKWYSYLTDDNGENKKSKGTKKCFIKQKRKSEDYKYRLEETSQEKIKLMCIVLEKIIMNL